MKYVKQLCKDAGRSLPFIVMNKWDKAYEEKESTRKKVCMYFNKNIRRIIYFKVKRQKKY